MCRFFGHKWSWSSLDYGRYVEYRCDRCAAQARLGWSWKRRPRNWKKSLVMKPTVVCNHSVTGGPLLCCMQCANLRPYPW